MPRDCEKPPVHSCDRTGASGGVKCGRQTRVTSCSNSVTSCSNSYGWTLEGRRRPRKAEVADVVGRSDTGGKALRNVSLRSRPEFQIHGSIEAKSERHRSWRLEARPRPPVLDARPPLRREWWGKARGCPSPACLQRSWWFPAPDFVAWVDPPFGANGAGRHIWHRELTQNRFLMTPSSVDYQAAVVLRTSHR